MSDRRLTSSGQHSVGFVGLGAIGEPMALRLVDAGYELAVYDRRPEAVERLTSRGARGCDSVRAVADSAAIVLTSLPSTTAVRDVTVGESGLLGGSAIRYYVDLSTTGPTVAQEVAATLTACGIACVDAPVSGGVAGAESGRLTIMMSGAEEALASVRPLIEVLGKNIFVVGSEPGQGQLAKVINNLLSGAALVLAGEAALLGVKGGLDPRVLLDVIAVSSGTNTAVTDKIPNQVLTRRFQQGFRLELMAKDVSLCLDESRRLGVPMMVGGVVEQLWSIAAQSFGPSSDCTEIVKLLEGWAAATVGEPGEA